MTKELAIRDRIKELRRVSARDLVANPKNWRKHPLSQQNAMRAVLGEIGFADALLAREDENGRLVLIDGHLRAEIAPDTEVPVLILDVTENEADKILATLDPLAGMAELDMAAFGTLADGIEFDAPEFGALLQELRGPSNQAVEGEDDVPEPPANPVTLLGDLWILGKNRLQCGDSTKPEEVTRLMNGEIAALMATDPPYLINYQGGDHPESWANKGSKKRNKHWDDYHDPDQSSDFFAAFIAAALPHLDEHVAIYQWHASIRQALVEEAWKRNVLHIHQQIIWVKTRPVLTRCDYMWQHEPAFYGWRDGKSPKQKPPGNERTVWNVSQAGESDGIHPTQKPVELFRRPLLYHTHPGGLAYEPFSGSFTAGIAAEGTGRRVYAMELSPQFVDVGIVRWQNLTGKQATLDGDGRTFAEIANSRKIGG